MTLRALDGKRVAVSLPANGRSVVFRGCCDYRIDPELGGVIRIRLPEANGDGSPLLIIQESSWDGDCKIDEDFGCDFALNLTDAQTAVR